MLYFVRSVAYSAALFLLLSCGTMVSTDDTANQTVLTIVDAQFSAWNDDTIVNKSIIKQIKQADSMMKFEQWDEAQSKLETVLRSELHYAPIWSRLSWLSLRKAKHNKAINLARRSNSNTKNDELRVLNLNFIRDAYKLLNRTDKVKSIDAMLKKIRETQ